MKHGHGVDKLVGGGSFVTLASPDHKHFTIVIETMVSFGCGTTVIMSLDFVLQFVNFSYFIDYFAS